MSSLQEVRWRLLWERLVKVYGESRQHETETLPLGHAPDELWCARLPRPPELTGDLR